MNDFKISMKAARVNRNLTAKQVAEMMGRSEKTILNWENAITPINADDFYKICDLYKIDSDFVVVPTISKDDNFFYNDTTI